MHTDLYQPWDDPYLQNQYPGKSEWRHIFSDKYDIVSSYTCGENIKEPTKFFFGIFSGLSGSLTHMYIVTQDIG